MRKVINKTLAKLLLIMGLFVILPAQAELNLVIDKSGVDGTVKIILPPFSGSGFAGQVQKIITADLERSGRFTFIPASKVGNISPFGGPLNQVELKKSTADFLVRGRSQGPIGKEAIVVEIININNGEKVASFMTNADSDKRKVAHQTADAIYKKLTGLRGAFSTKIAYVAANGGGNDRIYQLIIADADGYQYKAIVTSLEPIMSVSWSPKGNEVAYVSFESGRSGIYVQNLKTGQRRKVSSRKGINGAPSWSPNGQLLAVSLSLEGNSEIYTIELKTGRVKRITHARSIDTEPSWTQDGRSVIFTSNRGGSPQLYKINVTGKGVAKRITFSGRYNSAADVSGNKVAMVRQMDGKFQITLMDLSSRNTDVISNGSLDESPSLAPNGAMVLYETRGKGRRHILAVASDNGRANTFLYSPYVDVGHPAWSPFIH